MSLARFSVLLALLVVVGCTSIPAVGSPAPSAPAGASAPATSSASGSEAPSVAPIETAAVTEAPTVEPPTAAPPAKTPKPSRKPRATPTPTPVAIDLSIFVQTADIPNPWYTETDYTIPIHVAVAADSVPNSRARVTVPEENFATGFQTGPIAASDTYSHDVVINLPAMGPATLTLSVKAPAGYADYDLSNNKVTIPIQVLPKP